MSTESPMIILRRVVTCTVVALWLVAVIASPPLLRLGRPVVKV
ncbi:hypothetical protein [Candidatus Regiella insecticola]|nr:hypothetical protein [Candidatus Regiella insecticola]